MGERKNRHLLEVVRASSIEAHMPMFYWGVALSSAVYLINRIPSRTLDFQTSYQTLAKAVVAPTTPNLSPHVFGCVAFVHLHKQQRSKHALGHCGVSFSDMLLIKKGIDVIIHQLKKCLLY